MASVSIVIPTLNEARRIGSLIESLQRQTRPPDEILVVDGGSTDATVALAGAARVVRAQPPVGAQRQRGLEAATGDIVVFMDADTVPAPGFLERAIRDFERRRLDAAIPFFAPDGRNPAVWAVYALFNAIFLAVSPVLPSGGGMCIVVRREHALRCGGFRPDLVYEDIEFIRRTGRRGRFGVLPTRITVSARRFEEQGVLPTFGKYLLLSGFFTLGLFEAANIVPYRFGGYREEDPEEEVVVLVDEEDRPIGTAPKSVVHTTQTPLHRGFSVFVFDPHGRLLLQQRSASKRTWPLAWSNTCCGHPAPGESALQAARRRLDFELGLRAVTLREALPDFRYRAEQDGIVENEFCPVLVGVTGEEPSPRPDEVEAVRWSGWEEFVASAARGDTELSPWCVEEAVLLNDRYGQPDEALGLRDAAPVAAP